MRIYRPASILPISPEVPEPAVVSLEQALDHEATGWAQIRAQASQRCQEYQNEKKREQERAKEESLILRQQKEAQEQAQADSEATCPLTTVVSGSVPVTAGWEREIQEWAQIRSQATERYQESQDEKKQEQERAEEELLILDQQQDAQENTQAELEAICTRAATVSVSGPITLNWEREIEEWARIRVQAIERYQNQQLEREREEEREGEEEMEREEEREEEEEREREEESDSEKERGRKQESEGGQERNREQKRERDLAENNEHLPIRRQRQVAKRNSKLSMIYNWLNGIYL